MTRRLLLPSWLLTLLGVGVFSVLAYADPLAIGDPMPPIGQDALWLRGEPLAEFPEGQITVLEFWAPWCGPCVGAMPHVSDLADHYADKNVRVIGIAIWPNEQMQPVAEFIEAHVDDLRYDVCEDAGNALAKRYMDATGSAGIPTTMIVNVDGTLAWIGHPMDEELSQVIDFMLAGTYDASFIKQRQEERSRAQGFIKQANELAYNGKWDDAVVLLQQAFEIDPEQFSKYAVLKFQRLMLTLDKPEKAYAYGESLLDSPVGENVYLLENMARFVVEAPGVEPRDLDFAHEAAQRAVDLTGGSWGEALSTLASVWHEKGEHEAAVKTMRRAVILAQDQESPWLAEYKDELELYEELWNDVQPPPY
jgi:thiol-disulfide isomerase/thioredoxin